MLSVISPAKTLDFASSAPSSAHTQPDYLEASAQLIERLREFSPQQLSTLMGISDKLASLNAARYLEWAPPFSLEARHNPAKQAIFAFQGEVYAGLEAQRFNRAELERAQRRLRILSGLYGMLRPLDLIQPYRLEMGSRLENPAGATLYDFWRERLTQDLAAAVEQSGTPVLINLASNEYFKAIDAKRLGHRIITPVFKDEKSGKLKVISFYAKKARGWMSAWMIRHDLDDPEALKHFDVGGYEFDPSLSKQDEWVYTRPAQ